MFSDRTDAGRKLGARLTPLAPMEPIVIGLPRGGVVVAAEVARALVAPLDIWIVRKLGAPFNPEYGLGAVAEGGEIWIDHEALDSLELTEIHLEPVIQKEQREVRERVPRFRRGRPLPSVRGRIVIVVDDGLATGGTARVALHAMRRAGAARLVLAVPTGSWQTAKSLETEADEVICLETPRPFVAVGHSYEDFDAVEDETVIQLLDEAWTRT